MSDYVDHLPMGYYFQPRDYELVRDYLMNRAWGRDMPGDAIQEVDVYSCNPDQLPIRKVYRGTDNEGFYFAYIHRDDPDSEPDRSTDDGYWEMIGGDFRILHDNEVIGYKNTFRFVWGKSEDSKNINYAMEEYRLNPSISTDDPNIRNNIKNLVICKVESMPSNCFLVPEVEWVEEANEYSDGDGE